MRQNRFWKVRRGRPVEVRMARALGWLLIFVLAAAVGAGLKQMSQCGYQMAMSGRCSMGVRR